MVAVIKTNRSIRRTLSYNEQKLKQGKAELIHSMNYAKDTDQLSSLDKIKTLEKLTSLNGRAEVNSIHISLNFPISEHLSQERLRDITEVYMQKIGFGEQPYLVYQHHDAGHPHLHVVTTNIQRDGQRIGTHHLLRDKSHPALREIERDFNLFQAQGPRQKQRSELNATPVQMAIYGKTETFQAISGVLNAVIPNYKYISLEELNAILRIYNVVAEGGLSSSRMHQREGLVYQMLDEKGRKISAPINASHFDIKPTLKTLKLKFAINEVDRKIHEQRLKTAIDLALFKGNVTSIAELEKILLREKIQLSIHKGSRRNAPHLAYIDHERKTVFDSTHLGEAYSASALQQRCHPKQTIEAPTQKIKQRQRRYYDN